MYINKKNNFSSLNFKFNRAIINNNYYYYYYIFVSFLCILY